MKVRLGFVTNSSSSCFIISHTTQYSKKDLEKILMGYLRDYNKENKTYYTFDEVYGLVSPGGRKHLAEAAEAFAQACWGTGREYKKKIEKAQFIFFSAEDNSIPYEIIERIQNELGAEYYHLG